jgi:hypothetical protein
MRELMQMDGFVDMIGPDIRTIQHWSFWNLYESNCEFLPSPFTYVAVHQPHTSLELVCRANGIVNIVTLK